MFLKYLLSMIFVATRAILLQVQENKWEQTTVICQIDGPCTCLQRTSVCGAVQLVLLLLINAPEFLCGMIVQLQFISIACHLS